MAPTVALSLNTSAAHVTWAVLTSAAAGTETERLRKGLGLPLLVGFGHLWIPMVAEPQSYSYPLSIG